MPIRKVVILAGGLGSRLSEETSVKPKPMVEIGDKPILWHIMKIYSKFGINEFIICLGYKGYVIKEYFANYHLHMADTTFDFRNSTTVFHKSRAEPWKVTLVETGANTMTGGRLRRVRDFIGDEDFCMTYGDGVADIDIAALIARHKQNKTLATLTAVQPPGRFGMIDIGSDDLVNGFREKPESEGSSINGGFMVLSPKVLDYIDGDATSFEQEPLAKLARDRQLGYYRHGGFWRPMDTLRDKRDLEVMWHAREAPWKIW